jgi:hypothetical protein
MALSDFNFQAYDKSRLRHLQVHLEGKRDIGSFFKREVFSDEKSIADFALSYLNGYNGERLEIQVDMPYCIGYDGVVSLSKVPSNARIFDKFMERKRFYVPVVRGVSKQPTKHIVIVAGPLRKKRTGEIKYHGFYTVFPGTLAPTFPVLREVLQRRYVDGELRRAVEENEERAKFWREHGLVID